MHKGFADFLESMYITDDISVATEADDITAQVAGDVKKTVGGTPSTRSDADTRSEDEDLEKTDDIFDLKKDDDPAADDNSGDDASDDAGTDTANDSSEDTSGDDSTDNNSENLEDSGDTDDSASTDDTPTDDLVFTKKNKIRDNIVQLYTIISGNIESIEASIININEAKTIEVLNMVISNLRNCKTYIYNTLTKELKTLEYDELLRRYITIKRVYDISIEMMEAHFKKVNKDKNK